MHALNRIAALVLVVGVSSAHAGYSANATAGASASMHAGTVYDSPPNANVSTTDPNQWLQVSKQASVLDPAAGLTESAGGAGWAAVSPGALHLSTSGTAFVQGGPEAYDPGGASGYGYASGGFSDTTVWNVSGVAAGTVVTVDFQMRVDGLTGINMVQLQGGTASGYRVYEWDLRFAGIGQHSVVNSDQPDDFRVFSFTTQLTVGAPVALSMSGSVGSGGKAGILCSSFYGYYCDPYTHGASVTSFADLSHTLAWNGVTGLYLGNTALPLSALSVMSDSGFDYTRAYVDAVPEPGSAALLAAGVLVLLGWRARSKFFASPASNIC